MDVNTVSASSQRTDEKAEFILDTSTRGNTRSEVITVSINLESRLFLCLALSFFPLLLPHAGQSPGAAFCLMKETLSSPLFHRGNVGLEFGPHQVLIGDVTVVVDFAVINRR